MATERKTRAVGYAFQHIPTSPPVPHSLRASDSRSSLDPRQPAAISLSVRD